MPSSKKSAAQATHQKAVVTNSGIQNTEGHSSPHTYATAGGASKLLGIGGMPVGVDASVNQSVSHLEIQDDMLGRNCDTLKFTLDNTSPPIANMIRRIFISEVPTVAFDRILISQNDGVVMDEVLSHRLAMTPIRAPADQMQYQQGNFNREVKAGTQGSPASMLAGFTQGVDFNNLNPKLHIVFDLDVKAPANGAAVTPVYSGALQWVPLPGQEEWEENKLVNLVHPDILLAKLGRNQAIKLRAVAVKGLGMCHAKWSPVSACWYRMRNDISCNEKPTAEVAKKLKKICPMKVFDIEDSGDLRVANPEKCTLCRECLSIEYQKQEPWFNADGSEDKSKTKVTVAPYVKLEKNLNVVEFTMESLGQYDSVADVVRSGLSIFAERCRSLKENIGSSEPQKAATSSRAKKRGLRFRSWWRRNSTQTRLEQFRSNPQAYRSKRIRRMRARQAQEKKQHARRETSEKTKKTTEDSKDKKAKRDKDKETKRAAKK